MSREIKFRLWDKSINLMRNNSPESLFHISIDGTLFFDGQYCDKDKFEIMQFTGLLDSEEREIYEGDICSVLVHKYHTFIDYIKFENGQFKFSKDSSHKSTFFKNCSCYETQISLYERLTVIGNIFEDSHYLENHN